MSESNQVKWRGVRPTNPESCPIEKGRVFNTAIGADTDFFAATLTPTNTPTTFRIYVVMDTAGVLTVRRRNIATAVTVNENLNAGANLNADAAYIFDFLVTSLEDINFRYGIAATIIYCLIVELRGGSA